MIQRMAATAAAIALLATGLVSGPLVAQSAAPEPSGAPVATPATGASGGVPYIDSTGVTHGTLTIRSIADPYTEFDPNYPPGEGQKYVLLDVLFEAAADEPFWADPYAIVLQDTAGYLRSLGSVPRVQPVKLPDFQSQTLGPGDRLSGAIGYVVPATSTIAEILYAPESERIITAKSIATAEPRPVGTEVEVVDSAGVVHGTAMVRQFQDPYAGDPTRPPAEGTRYVLATVVFQAAIDQQLAFDPYQIVLQDKNGFLIRPSGVPRPAEDVVPDLQGQTLAPDDRSSGYVGYNVPADTEISAILWSPENGRLVKLADITPGG